MKSSRIIGTGSYAPEKILTNEELSKLVDTSDEWITSRTGIKQRHIAREGEQTSDMAAEASKKALEMAGLTASDLDMIIVGTISGDMPMPACAAFVQAKLGAKCPAFDVSAACAGSLFGLSIADQFVKTGAAKNVLVLGVELLSRILNWEDRNTCVLFGDAAGAMILAPSENESRGILSTHIHTDGDYTNILTIPGGGSISPMNEEMLEKKLNFVHMNGREVYKFAVRSLTSVIKEGLSAHGFEKEDVDHVVPHQANIRIVDAVLKNLKIPKEKTVLNIDRYGNTSSASVPVTLDEAVRSGRIKEGELVAMMAIGAGMSWGSAMIRW
ncbi:MAG: beta-ketoacyl-ACP synthase III [Myxococcota bacterium]|nr:beta-ketoacyl-ACP synthase III [Myxococcota bacterium]